MTDAVAPLHGALACAVWWRAIGAGTTLFGVLYALMQHDLARLLDSRYRRDLIAT